MRDYNLSFVAAQTHEISVFGNCIHFVEGSGPVRFMVDGSANTSSFLRDVGSTLRIQAGFARITITSPTAQNIKVCLGDGESYKSGAISIENIDVGIDTPDSLIALDDVTIPPLASVLLVQAKPSRRELRLTLPETAKSPIRFGPQEINAEKGGIIYAGVTEYITNNGAIYAFNTDENDPVSISILSLEKL